MLTEALIWAILLLPVASFLLIGLAIRPMGARYAQLAGYTAITALGIGFVLSVWLLRSAAHNDVYDFAPYLWLDLGAASIEVGLLLDPLTNVMLVVVTGVSLMVQIYSLGYMKGDESLARYYAYMSLFSASMIGLVLAVNIVQMYVFWELVGLSSYLLIGFWHNRPAAAAAAKKAFIVTRIGDVGFLLAIIYLFFQADDFAAHGLNALHIPHIWEAAAPIAAGGAGIVAGGAVLWLCLGLFAGAAGKSGQFPLHTWLPDAMEGPTPVSALIHAATMVAAGVFLVGRFFPVFAESQTAMMVVALIGAFTAVFAATMGLAANDIKRVMAYSTVSQLGYMMAALGVGAYNAALFHLFTHAFFKALLFLGSGSVIHGMNEEQDMRRMGALRQYMPVTALTMTIGAVAIAGIPPFSGFFSKDEILFRTFLYHGTFVPDRVLWGLAVVTAVLTAFYMFRLINMTFFGAYRGPTWGHGDDDHGHDEGHGHAWHGPHESPRWMTFPLVVLAGGAMLAGFVGVPVAFEALWPWTAAIEHFLHPSFVAEGAHAAEEAHHMSLLGELGLMAFSVLIALGGIWFAYRNYVERPEAAERMAASFAGPHRVLTNKYYVDELYDATVVRGTMGGAQGLWTVDRRVVDGAVNGTGWATIAASWVSHVLDKYVVDGLVNLIAWTCDEASYVFRRAQTGLIQNYAFATLLGVFAFVTWFLVAR
jgi:NADH-quinone oxidoreductase subunit L